MDCYETLACQGRCTDCPARETRGNLVRFAEEELRRAGLFDADSDYGGELGRSVLRIVRTFAQQRFSGFAAGLAASALGELVRFKPITPLTDDPAEWQKVDGTNPHGGPMWQNRRRSDAFSWNGGRTYYLLDDPWPWYRRWFGIGRRSRRAAAARGLERGSAAS